MKRQEIDTYYGDQKQAKSMTKQLLEKVAQRSVPLTVTGIFGSAKAYFTRLLYRRIKQTIVIVTSSSNLANQWMSDLRFFGVQDNPPIFHFPAYNFTPFKTLSYQGVTAADRIATLYRLTEDQKPCLIVTTIEALGGQLIPKQKLLEYAELVMVGEQLERDDFADKLIRGGYTRSVLVEEPGDFCLRGGIIDVFPPLFDDPVRIELFGDTVDSVRTFSASSQRSKVSLDEVVILPSREAVFDDYAIDEVLMRLRMQASAQGLPLAKVREVTGRLKTRGSLDLLEGYLSIVYSKPGTLFDYLPDEMLWVLDEPAELDRRAEALSDRIQRNFMAACKEDRLCVQPDSVAISWKKLKKRLFSYRPVLLKKLSVKTNREEDLAPQTEVAVDISDNELLKSDLRHTQPNQVLLRPLSEWIQAHVSENKMLLIVCHTKDRAKNLIKMLGRYDVYPHWTPTMAGADLIEANVWVTAGEVSSGFVWPGAGLAMVTEVEIFNTQPVRRKRVISRQPKATPTVTDLNSGDLIVHTDHGIGRYEGLVTLSVAGLENDFLLIMYKDDDRLYLPVDRMGMIEKYMGLDGTLPSLDKMGGLSWARAKARMKRSAEKIAGELLELYASRQINQGFSFREPSREYQDFTAAFAFEETPDQKKAIADVMADMARPTPMDRLVCGDVGYGKTEVALRATYLATENSKQVALIVPTTILAEQHYSTFADRFKRTPFTVACLSRFRSTKHQNKIIQQLKSGGVDIVIGTHRLFSKDVSFKDLGLMILDEEQRFGVKHKEKLKKMRTTVDVLALTATPIPRTLHLSLTGVRDISTISTPPEYRQAIATYVCEYEESIIKEAIKREMARGGQIYFVHNDIAGIERMAGRLKQLVPDVRLDVAHGRMPEDELERTMYRFQMGEFDMLVCTTIIESGLDVPTANTMLVNRADRFGLAQMYQLRGRVGRSDRQAYAYLIIHRESHLTPSATKRLKVLMAHSDLGSGFQIAMHDLKIRGGGTILGAAQSGHIAAVGYDMFLKLMRDAVANMKGQPTLEPLEPEINLPLVAHIPESYVPEIDQRLGIYRRLARMTEPEEMKAVKNELKDRFGELPQEVMSLLVKILLRILAIKAGVKKLDVHNRHLVFHLSFLHIKNTGAILDWVTSAGRDKKYQLSSNQVLKVVADSDTPRRALSQTKKILKEIIRHANS